MLQAVIVLLVIIMHGIIGNLNPFIIVSANKVEIDISLLGEKIIYMLQNRNVAKQLGKNARERYLTQYSSSVFRKNMIAFYKSLFVNGKDN